MFVVPGSGPEIPDLLWLDIAPDEWGRWQWRGWDLQDRKRRSIGGKRLGHARDGGNKWRERELWFGKWVRYWIPKSQDHGVGKCQKWTSHCRRHAVWRCSIIFKTREEARPESLSSFEQVDEELEAHMRLYIVIGSNVAEWTCVSLLSRFLPCCLREGKYRAQDVIISTVHVKCLK